MTEQLRLLEMAGIRVRVESDGGLSEDPGILADYLTEAEKWDYVLRAVQSDAMPEPEGTEVYSSAALRVYRQGEAQMRFHGEVQTDPRGGHICVRQQGRQIEAVFRHAKLQQGITSKLLLTALDLPHLLTNHGGFLLHASFIEYEGGAILFTAPSETGKSTQAQLWCDHAGAALVNGDRAAVRIMDGQVLACGTPYSGSSPVRRNVKLPLRAIVLLSQAPVNQITKLRGLRAFRAVLEGCTVNVWDRSDVELATRTVTEVIGQVPVYHLACTPDVRAVELLKQTMEVEK
ncbi:MAG: hypothetical protein IKD27_01375 [Oscillospiraceae bacterium]|nr:hypothetical protein [Oscillospiraceae bacterium]